MGNCRSQKTTEDLIQFINGIEFYDLPSEEQTRISAALIEAVKRNARKREEIRSRNVTLIDHRCIIR